MAAPLRGTDPLNALRQTIAGRSAVIVVDSDTTRALSGGREEAGSPGLLDAGISWCVENVPELPVPWADFARNALRWGVEGELSAFGLVVDRITERLGGRDGDGYGSCLRTLVGTLPLAEPARAHALEVLGAPVLSLAHDDLIERALEQHGPAISWRDPYLVRQAMEAEKTTVIRLYGRWDSPSSVMFGVADPGRLLGGSADVLRRLIVGDRSMVFLGSGADPALAVVRSWLLKGAAGTVGRHFWFCPQDVLARAEKETEGTTVTPIGYRSEEELIALLDGLRPPDGHHSPGGALDPWNNVAAESKPIVGRDTLLDEMGKSFAATPDTPAVLVLRGAMGVGKTRLAREFVIRSRPAGSPLWWIPAEHASTAEQTFAGMASPLGLPVIHDIVRTCLAVRARLEAMDGWTLVFDNVESLEAIQHLLPVAGSGRVLITTRLSDLETGGHAGTLTVRPLSLSAAMSLLDADGASRDQDLELLCRELDCLPQQLVPAREALARGMTARQLLTALRNRHAGDSEEATYAVAVDRLGLLSADSLDLLRLCSYLGPGPFDLHLLADPAGRSVLPARLRALLRDSGRLRESVRHIVSTGLAEQLDDRFELHRLVQHHVRTRPAVGENERWNDTAVSFMLALFPSAPENPESWPRCAGLLEHALGVGEARYSGTAVGPQQVILLNRCGTYLFARGAYSSSATIFRRAAAMLRLLTGQDANYAAVLSNLGLSRLNEGRLDLSRRLLERALLLREAEGAGLADLAASYSNLGCVLRELGDLHSAEHALAVGLELIEGHKAAALATYPKLLNNLGVVRMQLRLPDSLDLFERALAEESALTGDRRLEIATTTNNLGIAHSTRAEFHEAERALGEALAQFKQVLPEDHPDFGSLYNNLGLALRGQRRPDEALPYFEHALEIERRFLGDEHPAVAGTLINIGVTLRHLHRYAGAFLHQEKALQIFDKAYGGSEHPLLASTHGALGNMLRRLGDVPAAVDHHRRALEIETLTYPEGDFELAGTHDNLGRALRHMGRLDEAVEHFEAALAIKQRHCAQDDLEIAKTWDNLGVTHRFQGRIDEAVRAHEHALRIRRANGPDHAPHQLHYSLVAYAMACRHLGREEQAAQALGEAADLEALW